MSNRAKDPMLGIVTSAYAVGVMSRLTGQAMSFVTVMVASRFLVLAEFGTFVLAWAAVVIANSFVFTGFYQALLRSPDPEKDRDTIFWLIFAVGLISAIVIGVIGIMAGGMAAQVGQAFCLLAPIPMLMTVNAWNEAQLVKAKRIRAASLYVVLSEACGVIVAIYCLKAGYGSVSLIAARYAVAVVAIVLTFGLVGRFPRFRWNRDTILGCKTTVPPLWGTTAMGMFSNYGTDFVMGAFLNPAAVGAYRGGARITMTMSDLVLQPLTMLSWSRFSSLEQANRRDLMRGAWVENMTLAAALFWPAILSVAMLAPEFVSVVFDETWLPAAPIVAILAFSRILSFLSALLEPTMICCGKPGVQLKIRFVGVVLLLATLLLFGRFSVEAAAVAHLVTSAVVGVLSIAAMVAVLNLTRRDLIGAFLPGLILAGACALVVLGTAQMRADMTDAKGLFATILLLAAVWVAAMIVGFQRRILAVPKP